MKNKALEDRLLDYAVSVTQICFALSRSEFGKNLSQQLIRSSTSPALNYGEAQGAESKRDFVHKLRIAVKELRESYISLRIIEKAKLCKSDNELRKSIDECNQLISIFVASIRTAESKP